MKTKDKCKVSGKYEPPDVLFANSSIPRTYFLTVEVTIPWK